MLPSSRLPSPPTMGTLARRKILQPAGNGVLCPVQHCCNPHVVGLNAKQASDKSADHEDIRSAGVIMLEYNGNNVCVQKLTDRRL